MLGSKSFQHVTEPKGFTETPEFVAGWSETQVVWEPQSLRLVVCNEKSLVEDCDLNLEVYTNSR